MSYVNALAPAICHNKLYNTPHRIHILFHFSALLFSLFISSRNRQQVLQRITEVVDDKERTQPWMDFSLPRTIP